jgi:hypothetical protein
MTSPEIADLVGGPTLEELSLHGDLAEMADELREAHATIARLKAANAQLRKAAQPARIQMGAAA